jgi:YidC/Oxa1 family membrane protein insertase
LLERCCRCWSTIWRRSPTSKTSSCRIAWRHFGAHRWRYELEPTDAANKYLITFETDPAIGDAGGIKSVDVVDAANAVVAGAINWDIAILVAAFGATLFISQILSGMGMPANPQQATANKITPVMITAMFLFFPLPAGVLLYMVVANIFQGLQTFILSREALPENLQQILEKQMASQPVTVGASGDRLPFEPNSKK